MEFITIKICKKWAENIPNKALILSSINFARKHPLSPEITVGSAAHSIS